MPAIAVDAREERISERESGIDLNRTLQKRNCAGIVFRTGRLEGVTVQLPCRKRRRGGFYKRNGMFFDGGGRFAGFASEPSCNLR